MDLPFYYKLKELKMFRQNFNKVYIMVNQTERLDIINKIDSGEIVSETCTGKKQCWWIDKHNPNNEIPKKIYLLGKGSIQELHIEYMKKYGHIEWSDFIDHTRELIKQKIMV
jgi:hypothetical protein